MTYKQFDRYLQHHYPEFFNESNDMKLEVFHWLEYNEHTFLTTVTKSLRIIEDGSFTNGETDALRYLRDDAVRAAKENYNQILLELL